jgi:replicative DNA helicase
MLEKDALTVVLDILRPSSFYTDAHQLIFKAMMRLFEKSHPIDMLTVTEELKKVGGTGCRRRRLLPGRTNK